MQNLNLLPLHRCCRPPVPRTSRRHCGGSSHPRSLGKAVVGWYYLPTASPFGLLGLALGQRASLFVHLTGRGRRCVPLAAPPAFARVTKNGWKNERLRESTLKVGLEGKKTPSPQPASGSKNTGGMTQVPLFPAPFYISNTKSGTSPTSASAAADVAPFKICKRRGRK